MSLIETIIASALTSSAVIAVIALIGRSVIAGTISQIFNKRMERYKHQLTLISDKYRFDYERKTADFALYIKLKHEKYSKLYELIHIANGKLMGLYGFRKELTLEEFSKSDMETYLRNHKIAEGFILEVLATWETNKQESISRIRKYLRMIEFQIAHAARNEAKNYMVLNALYVSSAAETIVNEILTKMVNLNVSWEMPTEHGPGPRDEIAENRKTISEKDLLIEKLKNLMREELSVGAFGYEIERPINQF